MSTNGLMSKPQFNFDTTLQNFVLTTFVFIQTSGDQTNEAAKQLNFLVCTLLPIKLKKDTMNSPQI
jgi:hypothetical protein